MAPVRPVRPGQDVSSECVHPTRRTPPRWWLLVATAVVLIAVSAILTTRWEAITASQPAYLVMLLVVGRAAALGLPVVVVKAPYGVAFLASAAPSGIFAARPSVTRWVLGGHSLGDVVASSYAAGAHAGVDGLLLWASYPNGSIA